MSKRCSVLLITLVWLLCSLWQHAAAQNSCIHTAPKNSCFAQFTFWAGDTYLPYGSTCLCGDGVPRMYTYCWVATDRCSGICVDCVLHGGEPINFASGNTIITQTDVNVPGLGGGLTLTRTWNSQNPGPNRGMFGLSWMSTYEETMSIGDDGLVRYWSANGNLWSFGVTTLYAGPNGTQTIYSQVAPRNGGATVVGDGTYLTLTFKNGEKRVFSRETGLLLSISDRNGNTTQLSYDGYHLTTVTDAASRHLYFTYTADPIVGFQYYVTSVTSDFGVSLSYTYGVNGLLTKVARPDNTFVTFEYTDSYPVYLLTAVRDQDGKVLESHTYDVLRRGLSSQRANGVDAISVTYVQ